MSNPILQNQHSRPAISSEKSPLYPISQLTRLKPPLFSSTIQLVDESEFWNLLAAHGGKEGLQKAQAYSDEPYHLENRVILKPKAATDNAFECCIVGSHNGNLVNLAHLEPGYSESRLKKIEEAIVSDVHALPAVCPIRGLITGGRAYIDIERMQAKSRHLFKTLESAMAKAKVFYVTKIWGRKRNGATSLFFLPQIETWFLHIHSLIRPHVLTLNDLKDTFEVIQIADGDTLKTKNTTHPGPITL